MKLLLTSLLLGIAGWPGAVDAQLQLVPGEATPCVFAGQGREIAVAWRNAGNQRFESEIRMALFQASSSTAAPLGTVPWKNLEVLPGQTVLESAKLDFPAVNAATRFVIRWVAGDDRVLGTSDVLVHPTNLLKELKPLAGDEPLGVLDPQNQLKPLLKAAAVEFSDLEDAGVEDYRGKLVIAGPFQSQSPHAAKAGVASRRTPSVLLFRAGKHQCCDRRAAGYACKFDRQSFIATQPDFLLQAGAPSPSAGPA